MMEKEFHKISPRGDYLIGKKFNKVTVIDFDKKEGYDLWWNCICDCGKKFKTTSRKLRTNPNISCGCSKKTAGIDLTGQTFGRLTVISKAENLNGKWAWNCICSCGNEVVVRGDNLRNGMTQSCGCLNRNIVTKDLTGRRFGKLIVLNKTSERQNGKVIWDCLCDCGNHTKVNSGNLISGKTQSCGCLKRERTSEASLNDLTGKRFGKLVAIEPTQKRAGSYVIWKCRCDCGEECEKSSWILTHGHTIKCPKCKASKGELAIAELLKINNIPFESEKRFGTCKDKNTLPFDFFVNNSYLIEFDGIQHFQYTNYSWNTKENFELLKKHDNIKNQWCKENNIPLIRIPYTHLDNLKIEDLKLETSSFII